MQLFIHVYVCLCLRTAKLLLICQRLFVELLVALVTVETQRHF